MTRSRTFLSRTFTGFEVGSAFILALIAGTEEWSVYNNSLVYTHVDIHMYSQWEQLIIVGLGFPTQPVFKFHRNKEFGCYSDFIFAFKSSLLM